MRFTFTIESANSAMTDEEYGGTAHAVAELLDRAAQDVRDGSTNGVLRDANGHIVGAWALTTD